MKTTFATFALLATGAVLAAACTDEVRVASATVEPRHTAATAAEIIAEADCNREQSCGNVGSGRKFSHPVECNQAKLKSVSRELGAVDCNRNGVADEDLDLCLEQIKNHGCENKYTTGYWEERADCGSEDLCLE